MPLSGKVDIAVDPIGQKILFASRTSNRFPCIRERCIFRAAVLQYRLLSICIAACADVVHWFASSNIAIGKDVFPYFVERIGFRIQGRFYNLTKRLSNLQCDVAKIFEKRGYGFFVFGKWVSHYPLSKLKV